MGQTHFGQWCCQTGAMAPSIPENAMVENEGPITGCLIHSHKVHAEVEGIIKDTCERLSFPDLPFRKDICHHVDRIKLGILHICRWLQLRR